MLLRLRVICIVCLLLIGVALPVHAEDWPMWRYDSGRTAASPEELPENLSLLWVRQYTPREPVWDDPLNQDLMGYDDVFEPVILGDMLYIGFNDSDKVAALDAATGEERWSVYLDGPVRLPVAGWKDTLFVTSDDGFLYALNRHTGEERWRFQAAPRGARVLGNKRLISTWPVRGGAVVAGDTVYFAAGIWPFMGTFIYALDAATGEVRWLNDGNGPQWLIQPHGAPSFSGVAPQGALVVDGDYLLVPGGRSVPACFDRATGQFLHYTHAQNNKTGGAFVAARDGVFFNHYREEIVSFYQTVDGKSLAKQLGRYPVMAADRYYFSGPVVQAVDAAQLRTDGGAPPVWEAEIDASGDLILAGRRLYAAGGNRISAMDIGQESVEPVWTKRVQGTVRRLAAANGRLFAVTEEGAVIAFGAETDSPHQYPAPVTASDAPLSSYDQAEGWLAETGVDQGYALWYEPSDLEFVEALLSLSELHIVVIASTPERVLELRKHYEAVGFLGSRVAVLPGEAGAFSTPPYCASVTVVESFPETNLSPLLRGLYESVRPYGGIMLFPALSEEKTKALEEAAQAADLPGLSIERKADRLILKREGSLPGSAPWTHVLGDIAQTGKSNDDRVKLPLGLLWFGGNSNLDVLPRHGHGPPEQVIGGRLFIEGMQSMSARDVYTGRVLWKKELLDLGNFGVYFDDTYRDAPTNTRYNQVHIPGANARGSNFVATDQALYVIEDTTLRALDPATGADLRQYQFPPLNPGERRLRYPEWGFLGVYQDVILGGAEFVPYSDLLASPKAERKPWEEFDVSASKRLAAFDRESGEIRWEHPSRLGFLHNAIAAGHGMVYCLDKLPPHVEGFLNRRGLLPEATNRLLAVDVATGQIAWSTEENVFGSFLCYSEELDILVQAMRASRDSLDGEDGRRMIAYRGATGEVLWESDTPYETFPLLHGTTMVTQGMLFDLLTGKPLDREDPITGARVPWEWDRQYGCNYPIAGEHLLTFRSGAAGFCDLAGNGGTGNFGGFKSSCTSNLIIADGVLNAPDYTRTCSCAYPNQTSLALVHDPSVEFWTYNNLKLGDAPVQRLGLNLGAPGDRQADDGTLWIEYPVDGGPSPEIPVTLLPETPVLFRHHSARARGEGLAWVAASGMTGVEELRVRLRPEGAGAHPYTVRLYFCEWENPGIGGRVFDVQLQGATVLERFDILQAAEPKVPVVREFSGIAVDGELAVEFTPHTEAGPLLCGLEVVAE